jgi:hypothetical protein
MGRSVLIALLMLAASHSAIGQNAQPSSTAFHWLNSSNDAALLERIKTAFADELKPDDPEKVKPVVAQEYKWISRVGVFETSALVLIGERETRTSTYGNYFVAFNYDLKSGEKTSLTQPNKGFMQWKFKRLVRFDSSSAPDIVFIVFLADGRKSNETMRRHHGSRLRVGFICPSDTAYIVPPWVCRLILSWSRRFQSVHEAFQSGELPSGESAITGPCLRCGHK